MNQLISRFVKSKQSFHFAQLTYLHFCLFGGSGKDEEVYKLAAAVELWILSLDMLDDFEDNDNDQELWMKEDRGVALNSATLLYTLPHLVINSLQSPHKHKISEYFHHYSFRAMIGQHQDLAETVTTEEECLAIMRRKSGALTALAATVGTILANGDCDDSIHQYATELGVAAQIDNDFNGLFQENKEDGKTEKPSLTMLYIKNSDCEACQKLREYAKSRHDFTTFFGSKQAYMDVLWETGVVHYLQVMKHLALQKAKKVIGEMSIESDTKEILYQHLFDEMPNL